MMASTTSTSSSSGSLTNANTPHLGGSSTAPTEEQLSRMDEDMIEYLLFRGFTKTITTFEADRRDDRLKAFDVDRLLAHIDALVRTYDIQGLLKLWDFLDRRLFSHLDVHHARELHKMKVALLRYYVVYAIKSDRRDKAIDFLANYTLQASSSFPSSSSSSSSPSSPPPSSSSSSSVPHQLQAETDAAWRQWFVLPHLPDPARDPQFHVFFSPSWADTFRVSLRNVLTVIFYSVPVPKLLTLRAYEEGAWQVKSELVRARQAVGERDRMMVTWQGGMLKLTQVVGRLVGAMQGWREEGRHQQQLQQLQQELGGARGGRPGSRAGKKEKTLFEEEEEGGGGRGGRQAEEQQQQQQQQQQQHRWREAESAALQAVQEVTSALSSRKRGGGGGGGGEGGGGRNVEEALEALTAKTDAWLGLLQGGS